MSDPPLTARVGQSGARARHTWVRVVVVRRSWRRSEDIETSKFQGRQGRVVARLVFVGIVGMGHTKTAGEDASFVAWFGRVAWEVIQACVVCR